MVLCFPGKRAFDLQRGLPHRLRNTALGSCIFNTIFSLCRPGCSGTDHVDQVSLRPQRFADLNLPVLGLRPSDITFSILLHLFAMKSAVSTLRILIHVFSQLHLLGMSLFILKQCLALMVRHFSWGHKYLQPGLSSNLLVVFF